MNSRAAERSTEAVMAILLDYYFLYLITLLSLRVFDGGQAGTDLDRLNALLAALQGQDGSGQQFVENSETLITLSTSQFGPDEDAYLRLLDRVRSLDHVHRTRVALTNSGILASHLRFGFEATYGRDLQKMREDNVPDYPWLCVSLLTLLQEYERLRSTGATDLERRPIVEGILNGLTPDCGALLTDLDAGRGGVVGERLEIGVGDDELDAVETRAHHPVHGVAAAAANADHLDPGARGTLLVELQPHRLRVVGLIGALSVLDIAHRSPLVRRTL
jgi:hypothetical protein